MTEALRAKDLLKLKLENGKTVEEELRVFEHFARLLDTRFRLFGVRFGLDSLLGLIPVAGDVTTGAAGLVALGTAARLKLPASAHARIAWNLLFDTLIGAIPLFGDVFDFFNRSHTKNFKVVEKHLMRRAEAHAKASGTLVADPVGSGRPARQV